MLFASPESGLSSYVIPHSKGEGGSPRFGDGEGHKVQSNLFKFWGGRRTRESKRRKGVTAYLWAVIMNSFYQRDIHQFVTLPIIKLVMHVSSVPAEHLFPCMNLLKNGCRNRFGEEHLNTTVKLFTPMHQIEGFPYGKALDVFFLRGKSRRGVYGC